MSARTTTAASTTVALVLGLGLTALALFGQVGDTPEKHIAAAKEAACEILRLTRRQMESRTTALWQALRRGR